MNLNEKLAELKHDYVRLQGDLEKRESVNQQVDPLLRQLEDIEQEIAEVRSEISQKEH
ncbi:SE1832 family protein [Staphylococcus succinus]|uniref:SE1832 family protein n=1 Tax=Staphylococcus succinus TaxID=61015 RepID=UPI0018E2B75E|nr:SE1832 family protein [Staphylococcus succinus]MEB7462403.1 SE1832 family protein [Staphylococcus succinus]